MMLTVRTTLIYNWLPVGFGLDGELPSAICLMLQPLLGGMGVSVGMGLDLTPVWRVLFPVVF
jgi:hypothetical protein